MAEREGFEPSVGYKPTHAFQACALNHSAISPSADATVNSPRWAGNLFPRMNAAGETILLQTHPPLR